MTIIENPDQQAKNWAYIAKISELRHALLDIGLEPPDLIPDIATLHDNDSDPGDRAGVGEWTWYLIFIAPLARVSDLKSAKKMLNAEKPI